MNQTEWTLFKDICLITKTEFPHSYLTRTLEEIENDFRKIETIWNKWKSSLSKVNETMRVEKDKLRQYLDPQEIPASLRRTLTKLEDEHEELFKNEPRLAYSITIDGGVLVEMIKEKRKWMENEVNHFNKKSFTTSQLKDFIDKCSSIIDSASSLFSNHNIIACINPEGNKIMRHDFESTRLKLSIERVFDTGLNIMVLGEAGAGKSTSLQMYALNNSLNPDKLIIWVPLSRLVHHWLKETPTENRMLRLEEGIVGYLSSLGVPILLPEFEQILKKRKVVVLLDAIDEVFNLTPWLIEGIKNFSERYKENVQVISTSRMSGSYVKDLPFFAVTLLPFTNSQRDQFIDNWFEYDHGGDTAAKIKKHLKANRPIGETIKNPLLTTTLCVLAEHNLQLPSTEIKLYDDRIKLLTGYYDNVKSIDSRITTTPQLLEILSQKLAYYFHSIEQREGDLAFLREHSVKLMLNKMSIEAARKAFDELIDPCNILVPMSDEGKVGFGHLRFQEHLAAKEIASNRGIDIFPLLQKEWWRSVLLIFSKMNDDLHWLIRDAALLSSLTSIKQPLIELIKTRPSTEQTKLKELLNYHLENENLFLRLEESSDFTGEE